MAHGPATSGALSPEPSAQAATRFETRYAVTPATPPTATGTTAAGAHAVSTPTSTLVRATPAVAVTSDQTRGRATAASRASRRPSHDLRDARSVLNRYSANTSQMNDAPNAASAGRTSCRWALKAPGATTASVTACAGSVASPTATAAGGSRSRIARTPATIAERQEQPSGRGVQPTGDAGHRHRGVGGHRDLEQGERHEGERGRRAEDAPREGGERDGDEQGDGQQRSGHDPMERSRAGLGVDSGWASAWRSGRVRRTG